jgi:hypothetical protein
MTGDFHSRGDRGWTAVTPAELGTRILSDRPRVAERILVQILEPGRVLFRQQVQSCLLVRIQHNHMEVGNASAKLHEWGLIPQRIIVLNMMTWLAAVAHPVPGHHHYVGVSRGAVCDLVRHAVDGTLDGSWWLCRSYHIDLLFVDPCRSKAKPRYLCYE